MRINVAVPEARVTKDVLDATLEGVTRLNESLIEEGDVPTFREAVDHVRWKPEPPGDEHFDHAARVLGRGWGDCDDLAPWHAASLRVTGEDPEAEAVVRRSGPHKWHAVVQRSDGRIDDPSREAGMGQRVHGVVGAAIPIMIPPSIVVGAYDVARPQLALRPIRDRGGQVESWEARADLPWHFSPDASPVDVAMASLHRSPLPSQSIVGACLGALELGEHSDMIDDDMLDRVEAIADCCEGWDYEELAGEYGEEIAEDTVEVVGSFFKRLGRGFGKLGKGIVKVATSKFGRGLVSMIPGVGPVASTALDFAGPALNKALKGKKRRSAPRIVRAAPPSIIQPSPAQCAAILAQHYGVGAEEVGKFKFGKIFKKIIMPHTLITDRLPRGLRAAVDPTSLVHSRGAPKRRRRRRRRRRG